MPDAWKFSETATDKPELPEVKEFLKSKYDNAFAFGTDNLCRSGIFRLLGWAFDFRPWLRRFIYKQYGSWSEIYAPNKTAIRKVVYGRIDLIQEILN